MDLERWCKMNVRALLCWWECAFEQGSGLGTTTDSTNFHSYAWGMSCRVISHSLPTENKRRSSTQVQVDGDDPRRICRVPRREIVGPNAIAPLELRASPKSPAPTITKKLIDWWWWWLWDMDSAPDVVHHKHSDSPPIKQNLHDCMALHLKCDRISIGIVDAEKLWCQVAIAIAIGLFIDMDFAWFWARRPCLDLPLDTAYATYASRVKLAILVT